MINGIVAEDVIFHDMSSGASTRGIAGYRHAVENWAEGFPDLNVELRESNEELQRTLDDLVSTRLRLAEAQRDAMEKELEVARDIQSAMLPEAVPGSRAGLTWRGVVTPASYCGGDFWQVDEIDEHRTLFLVADVAGHGVGAALITAVLRAAFDAVDFQRLLLDGQVFVDDANAALLRHADGLKIAVLVNDFGALPIDADLIEAEDDNIISIAGGCVCCSYGNDLVLTATRRLERS